MNKLKEQFHNKFDYKKGTKCINCGHVENWHKKNYIADTKIYNEQCNAQNGKCKCKKYEVRE